MAFGMADAKRGASRGLANDYYGPKEEAIVEILNDILHGSLKS